MRPGIIFHVPRHMLGSEGAALPGLFQKLMQRFEAMNARVELRWRDREALAELGDSPDVHLVHNGDFQHPRVLNTGLAYIFPFWYCDPQGIFSQSSLVDAEFDPSAVDAVAADAFFAHLNRRLVVRRQSRYGQPTDARRFPKGSIAVFLQGDSDPVAKARYMSEAEMFEGVLAARGDRKVIVKPHPRNRSGDTKKIVSLARKVQGVTVTDANIHDILSSASVTVSTSSATALEGMLHRVPAILCGRSDLHHCAETVARSEEIGAAIGRAVETRYPFAAFLHWFLAENMLNAGTETLADEVLARMRGQGVDVGALTPGH